MNLLGPYKYLVDAIALAVLVGGLLFGIHKYNSYQQGIGEARIQAQWDAANLAALQAKREREIQFQKEKDDAIAQAQRGLQAANTAAAAAAQSGRVLDNTIQTILARASTNSIEANRRYTAAIATVFQDCTAAYRDMARQADGHAQDSLMLQNAWPK